MCSEHREHSHIKLVFGDIVDLGIKGIQKQNEMYQFLIIFFTEMNAGLQHTYNLCFSLAEKHL